MSTESGAGANGGTGTTGGDGAGGQSAGGTQAPAGGGTTQVTIANIPDEALKERLDRHARKVLADALGVKTPEEAKAMRERLQAMEKAEADRKAAEMSETQRLQAEAEANKARAAELEKQLAEEKRTNKINGLLHAKGVKNMDYARFLLDRETAGTSDPDYDAALSKAMGDPLTRQALGITGEAGQPTVQTVPANTSPAGAGTAPKPPTAGGASDSGQKTAKDMTAQEWHDWKRAHGMH